MKQLVLATRNKGKIKEFRELFTPMGIEVLSLEQVPHTPEIVEDGTTFAENAIKKAEGIAQALGMPALADDSGLEVDALQGEPGVYSARYAGLQATDEENNRKLIGKLESVPLEKRTARYVCVLALAIPGEETITAEGICEGLILSEPAGNNGFGYDPYFYVPQRKQTMAQLPPAEKNKISHRGQALRKLEKVVRERFM
jgi:XTP/dITP diphosphohydrolase